MRSTQANGQVVLLALLLGEEPLHDAEHRPVGHPGDGHRRERGAEVLDDQVRPVPEQGPGQQGEVGQSLGEVTSGQPGQADVDVADTVLHPRATSPEAGAHHGDVERVGQPAIDLVGAHRSAPGAGSPRILVPEMEDARPPRLRVVTGGRDREKASEAEGHSAYDSPQCPQEEVASQQEQGKAGHRDHRTWTGQCARDCPARCARSPCSMLRRRLPLRCPLRWRDRRCRATTSPTMSSTPHTTTPTASR